MKKIALILVAILLFSSLVACGGKDSGPKGSWDGKTLDEVLQTITADANVQIMVSPYPVANSEEAWMLNLGEFTFAEGVVYMPMISSQRFDFALFRLDETQDAAAFVEDLKTKLNDMQWVCAAPPDFTAVERVGDVVLYIAVNSEFLDAESVVEAFLNPPAAE